MAQLSRPYQIALVALLVLAVAWFALGRHHGSPSEPTTTSTTATQPSSTASTPSSTAATPAAGASASTSSASAPATSTHSKGAASASKPLASKAKKVAAPSATHHGSAASVKGPSHAVAKAHEAVASSKSSSKSSPSSSSASSSTAASASSASSGSSSTGASSSSAAESSGTSESAIPTGQHDVETALAHGKVPVVLFWNPAGADDVAVHGQVQQLGRAHLPIAVYEGNAEAVASFGAITREVPIYGTPTILVIAKNGQTTELTGLQEDFSIEQAIEQALRAPAPPR
jgi:hypothetical protein